MSQENVETASDFGDTSAATNRSSNSKRTSLLSKIFHSSQSKSDEERDKTDQKHQLELQCVKNELENEKAKFNDVEFKLYGLYDEIIDLEDMLKSRDKKINRHQQKIVDLLAAKRKLEKSLDGTKLKLDELYDKNKELKERVKTKDEQINTLFAAMKELGKSLADKEDFISVSKTTLYFDGKIGATREFVVRNNTDDQIAFECYTTRTPPAEPPITLSVYCGILNAKEEKTISVKCEEVFKFARFDIHSLKVPEGGGGTFDAWFHEDPSKMKRTTVFCKKTEADMEDFVNVFETTLYFNDKIGTTRKFVVRNNTDERIAFDCFKTYAPPDESPIIRSFYRGILNAGEEKTVSVKCEEAFKFTSFDILSVKVPEGGGDTFRKAWFCADPSKIKITTNFCKKTEVIV